MPNSQINRIKEVLQEQGRTQAWLTQKLEKSYVIVTKYCNNRSQPTLETLLQIAKLLDVDVRELLVSTKK